MNYLFLATLFFLPTYVIRFGFLGLPLNLLVVWGILFCLVFCIWIFKNGLLKEYFDHTRQIGKPALVLIVLFFIATTTSLFVGGVTTDKLGQYIVLVIEPLMFFKTGRFIFYKYPKTKELFVKLLFIFSALAGLYAVFQYITLIGLPAAYLGNSVEPKRALSFFEYPNAYSLFITPVLVFLLPWVFEYINRVKKNLSFASVYALICWCLGVLGLGVSLSRGGWIGFAVAGFVAVVVGANRTIKKTALLAAIIGLLVIFSVPNLRYRVILPFMGEKSAVSRLSLFETSQKMIKDSPLLGKGLLGYDSNFDRYNSDPGLSHYKYPHNLYLTLWVDTGLLGLLSFVGLLGMVLFYAYKQKANPYVFGVGLMAIALMVHGLVDVPYFKNDLAALFWIFLALVL